MLSVCIFINKRQIFRTNAVRIKESRNGDYIYLVDKKYKIKHRYDDGTISLAKKLIDKALGL